VNAQPFRVGDRVCTIRPLAKLPEGACGTVEQVFPTVDLYDVRFDSPHDPQIMFGSELALLRELGKVGIAIGAAV
jgi:hypothetical protein